MGELVPMCDVDVSQQKPALFPSTDFRQCRAVDPGDAACNCSTQKVEARESGFKVAWALRPSVK